jgi:uncharacterized membrane protein YbhN (UPF0104 family)
MTVALEGTPVSTEKETAPVPAGPPAPRLKRLLSIAVGVGLFGVSLWVLRRWFSHVSIDELALELETISRLNVVLAIIFTALSFVALVGYEYYAIRYVGRQISTPLLVLYSFITQSIAHAVGFAIFVGATIRYKLYAPSGLSILDIAKIQVFFTTTFGLGALTLIGAVLLIEPGPLVSATELPHVSWRVGGMLLLACVAGFIVVGAILNRPLRLFGHLIALPGAKVTVIQVGLGMADLMAVAASLYFLMPASLQLAYFELLGIFVAAMTLGLISHIPGSLGVFESAVILLIQPTEDQSAPLLGALIAFRAIYYILPLITGASLFGIVELRRWRHDHRRRKRRWHA